MTGRLFDRRAARVDLLEGHHSVGEAGDAKRQPGRNKQRVERVFPFLGGQGVNLGVNLLGGMLRERPLDW